jgi:hypothetical protein
VITFVGIVTLFAMIFSSLFFAKIIFGCVQCRSLI